MSTSFLKTRRFLGTFGFFKNSLCSSEFCKTFTKVLKYAIIQLVTNRQKPQLGGIAMFKLISKIAIATMLCVSIIAPVSAQADNKRWETDDGQRIEYPAKKSSQFTLNFSFSAPAKKHSINKKPQKFNICDRRVHNVCQMYSSRLGWISVENNVRPPETGSLAVWQDGEPLMTARWVALGKGSKRLYSNCEHQHGKMYLCW